MSYTSSALEMDHLVRDIHRVDGLIANQPQGQDHPGQCAATSECGTRRRARPA